MSDATDHSAAAPAGLLWKVATTVLSALLIGGIVAMMNVWSDVSVIREQIATDKARIQAVEERISFTFREEPAREGRLAKIEGRLDMMGGQLDRILRVLDRRGSQWGQNDQRSDLGPVIPNIPLVR